MPDSDEQALIEQARGDPQAFAALYERFVGRVYRYALRRTGNHQQAEDVTSATFEKALSHLRRSGWKGSSYLAWLYLIASQQLVQHYRRNQRYVYLPADQPGESNVEQQAQSGLQQQAIRAAMQCLSRDDQEVLALRLLDRLSGVETAQVLGCSPQNVSVRLYRALERLRQRLAVPSESRGGEEDGT